MTTLYTCNPENTHTHICTHSKCFCTRISWNHLWQHLIGPYHIWKHLDKQGRKPAANSQSEKVQQLGFRFFILPPELKTFRCVYVGAEMDSCQCGCLGQSVVPKVRKSFKLILVDLFDYTVVHWCQDRLFACEILVKVIHIPFGFLEMTTKCVFFSSENVAAVDTCAAQSGNTTVTVLAFSRCLLRARDGGDGRANSRCAVWKVVWSSSAPTASSQSLGRSGEVWWPLPVPEPQRTPSVC